MEDTLTLPPCQELTIPTDDIERYKERLLYARVKTEDDLAKMTPQEIKKLYLKHEQSIVDGMSDQMTKLFSKTYTTTVSKVLPINDETSLEDSLNKDVFLQAAMKEFFIPLYYKYGTLLAPLTVAANTAAHVDYQRLKNKYYTINNGTDQESETDKNEEQGEYD